MTVRADCQGAGRRRTIVILARETVQRGIIQGRLRSALLNGEREQTGNQQPRFTPVSYTHLVHQFQQGAAPETILQDFPALISLENVYGAITYYLAHESAVDEYLRAQAQKWGDFSKTADPPPALGERVTGGPRHP